MPIFTIRLMRVCACFAHGLAVAVDVAAFTSVSAAIV